MNWLDTIKTLRLPSLKSGAHDSPESGLCAMEMVAFMERLPHSDHPPCTCPVIAAFVRAINDRFSDADRQRLLAYLPRLVGTVSPEHHVERAEYLVREVAYRLVAPLYSKRWPEHSATILAAQTMPQIKTACRAARAAAAEAAAEAAAAAAAEAAAYAAAAAAADAAAAAAYAAAEAAAEAAAAAAAEAAAYAAAAAAAISNNATICLEILDGVLQIGPSAKTFSAMERVAELVELVR